MRTQRHWNTPPDRGALPIFLLVLGIAAGAFGPRTAAAAVYVNGAVSSSGDGSSWSQAYKTIADGVNAATFGEDVFVAEGIYMERPIMRSGVTVYGGFAGDGSQTTLAERNLLEHVTVISDAGGSLVVFNGVTSATLDGFTLTGGNAATGGGVYFNNADDTNAIVHCRIFGNQATFGGGIGCQDSSPLIYNCLITGNAAIGGGGGVGCDASSPAIFNCTISDNAAPSGGGISCSGASTPAIVNVILTGNTNFAIYEEHDPADPTVSYTLFYGNPDGAYSDFGGSTYLDSQVGALETDLAEASFLLTGDPILTGGPSGAWDLAGGVVYDPASDCSLLTDSLARFPTTVTLASGILNPNLAQRLQTKITSNTATVVCMRGNLSSAISPGDAYQVYDYHLLYGSPCVDTALSAWAPPDDLETRPRPFDLPLTGFDGPEEGYDVGAYEHYPYHPLVSFATTSTLADESVTTVPIAVSLSPHLIPSVVTVDYAVVGGAASGADYTILGSGALSLNSSSATTAFITIAITDDESVEPDETLILELSNPSTATLGFFTTHTLTILDNDTYPVASFATPLLQRSEGTGVAAFPVTLSKPAGPAGGTVDYGVAGGTAASGADFNLLGSGTLVFNPSSSSANVEVQIVDDHDIEPNETVVLALSNPTSITLGALATATLTILDDDTPSIYFTALGRTVDEGSGTIEVQLMLFPPASNSGAAVDLAVSGTAIGGGIDYSLLSPTTLWFNPSTAAGTIEIDVVDDSAREYTESVVIELTNPVDAILGYPRIYTLSIFDDEVVSHVSPSPEGNGSFGFTVSNIPDTSASRGFMAVGAYNEDGGAEPANSGRVHILGAQDRSLKRTLVSPNSQQRGQFGRALAGIADSTRDSRGDLIVGAPAESLPGSPPEAGAAYIFDGHTGALTLTLTSQNGETGGNFGFAVSGLGSPQQSLRRVLVGAYGERAGFLNTAGRVYVFNSRNGFAYEPLVSPNAQKNGFFGYAVANVPDIDGDGYEDFVVGAPGENRVYVYNGVTRRVLRAIQGQDGGYFGISVSGIRDVSGDLRGDIIVGADCAVAGSGLACPGRAYVFCGRSGGLLRTLQSPNQMDYGLFGQVVAGIPDINNDGLWDIAVGAQLESSGGGPDYAGRVYLFDGGSGVPVDTLVSPNEQEDGRFGCDVSGIEDLNGDGLGDLIVGSFSEAVPGSASRSGQAYVFILDYSSSPPPPPTLPRASSRHWQWYR
ncbi:MAG TPA: Calx-beta domain-containing protein [Sumerlaeia bacterium]|nr:Calx-beta domain-containing protein [Sumerlaeia bacterium]